MAFASCNSAHHSALYASFRLYSLLPLSLIQTDKPQIYVALFLLAPTPRPPFGSEKRYISTAPNGSTTALKPLPCWHDEWLVHRREAEKIGDLSDKHTGTIEEAELEMSVVIPAYNEEERLEIMLDEAVAFLDTHYGRSPGAVGKDRPNGNENGSAVSNAAGTGGYEILIVNDGSKDRTIDVALAFSRKHNLHDTLRICTLRQNRGKGGAVTHGFRHVRGAYAVFADADGASKFEDLAKLVAGCKEVADESNRAIAVGSRAHLVGSEAVVKVRNSNSLKVTILTRPSALPFEMLSCTPFISCSGSSPLLQPPKSATPNVASSFSLEPPCHILCPICTPKAGSSTLKC